MDSPRISRTLSIAFAALALTAAFTAPAASGDSSYWHRCQTYGVAKSVCVEAWQYTEGCDGRRWSDSASANIIVRQTEGPDAWSQVTRTLRLDNTCWNGGAPEDRYATTFASSYEVCRDSLYNRWGCVSTVFSWSGASRGFGQSEGCQAALVAGYPLGLGQTPLGTACPIPPPFFLADAVRLLGSLPSN